MSVEAYHANISPLGRIAYLVDRHITLMKKMTSVATTMMSEEEKADLEKEMNDNLGMCTPQSSQQHVAGATTPPPAIAKHNTVLTYSNHKNSKSTYSIIIS